MSEPVRGAAEAGETQSQPQRYVVLGSAGHIDHGKTALIRALTGVDCDTLAEEKQRGITINLGFAFWRPALPGGGDSGVTFGIVDVPGHQRFVRNMVAGAIGIDLLLLVVAADDGVMPQTVEHLHIARLLGVQAGVVALNKADLVDEELLELARADVEDLLHGVAASGTPLAQCPIIPVSALTGAGLPELTAALLSAAAQLKPRHVGDRFRMPVDRSFSIRGAGTVVTGTTLAGQLKLGDELQVLPSGKRARVRGLQVHGQAVQSAGPGRRTAINLTGIEKDEIRRGDVLVEPESLSATTIFDAKVELLAGTWRPLRSGSEVLLHIGTSEASAKLQPLDQDTLAPGLDGLVQFTLEEPLAIAAGDRFILRSSSSEYTIGGGQVLDAHPTRHRRQRHSAAERLERLEDAGGVAQLVHEIEKAPFGLSQAQAQLLLNIGAARFAELLAEARAQGQPVVEHADGRQLILTLPANQAHIVTAAQAALRTHHGAHALSQRGLDARELLKMVDPKGGGLSSEVLRWCLANAAEHGELARQGETFSLPGRTFTLSERERRAAELIVARLNASAQPDQPDEFGGELPLDKPRLKVLLEHLVEQGQVILAPGGVYFGPAVVARVREVLAATLAREGGVSVSRFGEVAGTSRKYSIPLLQYFEQDGMLVRDGDVRRLKP